MEFDEIVVKESPGLCRCCLSEGCYKDMGSEYTWMNENEVYADMLLECFDIGISQHNDGPNGPNRLICEVCITRLRDACNFKKQVLDSEKKFVDMIGRGEFRPKVLIYQSQMKAEVTEVEDNTEVEYLEEDLGDYGDDDEPLRSAAPVAGAAPAKRGRPRKALAAADKRRKADDRPKTSKGVVKGKTAKKREISVRTKDSTKREKKAADETDCRKQSKTLNKLSMMRQNVIQVLLKSTVMPFRWLKSSFRCFYCYDVFQEPKDLKCHQIMHTSDDDILKAMKNYWESTVYVDVSTLSCKLCSTIITDFYKLIDHLIEQHGISFNKDIGICMNPFKLNNISVTCVQCERECRTFGHLLVHTNKEHKGCSLVLCEFCGQHFKSKHHLRHHMNKEHTSRSVLCPQCGEEVHNVNKMRTHMQNVHNKRYKCLMCSEMFDTHYKRSRHVMLVHKTREEVKCQHCPRTFVFRSTMMRHVRETHLQERNAVCGVCGWKAFGPGRLQRHMMKHSNERNFKCPACEKAFKTKKTMKQHYSNIHEKGARIDMMAGISVDALVQNSI